MTISVSSRSISITEAAAVELAASLSTAPDCYIRLGVTRVAERSFQYALGVDDEMTDVDVLFEFEEQSVRIISNLASLQFLGDVTIDFVGGKGFNIENSLAVAVEISEESGS